MHKNSAIFVQISVVCLSAVDISEKSVAVKGKNVCLKLMEPLNRQNGYFFMYLHAIIFRAFAPFALDGSLFSDAVCCAERQTGK